MKCEWANAVRREDGTGAVDVSANGVISIEGARALAWQLLLAAHNAETGKEYRDPPAWLVWERAADGGRPWLRAIDLSEQGAERHVAYLKSDAKYYRPPRPEPDLLIEQTRLDHLYAASLIEALRRRAEKTER